MTVRVYQSTDTNAPTWDGLVGSAKTVIVQCLVTGYTGKDPAGWTMPFEDGNTFVLRNSVASGSGAYFRFDDSVGNVVRLRGYSAMTDENTGDDPTPTVDQKVDGCELTKSTSSDSTARDWIIVADDRTVWISTQDRNFYGWGDHDSNVPGDGFAWFIAGDNNRGSGASVGNSDIMQQGVTRLATPTSSAHGLFLPRGYNQTAGAIQWSVPNLSNGRSPADNSTPGTLQSLGGNGAPMVDPGPGTSLRHFMPAFVGSEGTIRGVLRGLYVPLNNLVDNVTNGENIASPAGLPIESTLKMIRAQWGEIPTFNRVGALGIEIGIDW